MPRYPFRADPAWVTVSEGLSLGFSHWAATATYWAIPVLVVGILSTIVYWVLEASIVSSLPPSPELYDRYTGEIDMVAILTPMIPGFIASTVIIGIVTLVTRWIYYALAISGLRGREVSSGLILGRGVRAFVADLLFLMGFVASVALLLGVASAAGSGLAILLGLGAACASLYLQVRLAFWTLMIFDGAGIIEAASASWQASAGAIGRMIGWALAVAGVGFLVNIGVAIATAPLAGAIPLQSGVKAGATEAFAVFQLFTLAVIYESQLRRTMPNRASPPPAASIEPLRPWPGYAPVDPGSAASGAPPWPPAAGPAASPTPATPASGPWPAWETPPINPDAPETWDTEPVDPDAPPAPPQPPAPPA